MPKAKVKIRIKSKLEKFNDQVKSNWGKFAKDEVKETVVAVIQSGYSPVAKGGGEGTKGKGNYKKYSKGYATWKGVSRLPVDMTLSGKMLKSLKARETKDGFRLWFSSEIAKYHDKLGAGKSRVLRRLLPRGKEKFIDEIMDIVMKSIKKAIKKSKK